MDQNNHSDRMQEGNGSKKRSFDKISRTKSHIDDKFSSQLSLLFSYKKPLTSLAFTPDRSYIISGSKDGSVLRWECETGKKTFLCCETVKSHPSSDVYSVLAYNDNLILSGRKNSSISLSDIRMKTIAAEFEGHIDAVTGLVVKDENFMSISLDRSVKVWDLRTVGCIDTMFGHQGGVTGIDCVKSPITCSTDRTLRLWSSSDDTHSIFRGSRASIECVHYISDDNFVSGGADGSINLWRRFQKNSISRVVHAHGCNALGVPNWVTSLACLRGMNVFASGSLDGFIRFWKIDDGNRVQPTTSISTVSAVVNDMRISSDLVIAALGKEHRLGRWWVFPGDVNKLMVCKINADALGHLD